MQTPEKKKSASFRAKRYVTVNADYLADGTVIPRTIVLDRKPYPIENVLRKELISEEGIRTLSDGESESLAQDHYRGKLLIRYTVVIFQEQTFLYQENSRWYVEVKESLQQHAGNVT